MSILPVGSIITNTAAAASSLVLTKTGVTAGNTLISILSGSQTLSTAQAAITPTDTLGTWLKAGSQAFSSEAADNFKLGAQIAYQANVAAGTHTVTWSFPNGNMYAFATLVEWPGILTFDQSSPNSNDFSASPGSVSSFGTGTTPTLSSASEIAIAAFALLSGAGVVNAVITDPPSGFTSLNVSQDTANTVGGEHCYINLAATTGISTSWSWTDSTGRAVNALIATFSYAGGGGDSLMGQICMAPRKGLV